MINPFNPPKISSKRLCYFFPQLTPNLPKSPSGMTISGTKVKKMNYDDLGRSSRLSVKTPAHWGKLFSNLSIRYKL